jgi:pimeloyl-ACP methyl ester carboxylesterase
MVLTTAATKGSFHNVTFPGWNAAVTPCRRVKACNGPMRRLSALLLCLLLTGPLLAAPAPAQDAPPFPNSRFETLDGVRVHVRQWPAAGGGRGCPVLLLHGLGGSTFSFRELAPALAAAGHPVWALDLPAYGYSARVPFPRTAGGALAPWLQAQAPGPWCLLGHSMGTRVVAELAQRPAFARSVVYIAGNPILSPRELRSRERFRSPRFRRFVAGLVESRYLGHPERIADLIERAYNREPRPEEVRGYLTPLQRPGTALAILTGYSAQWPPPADAAQLDRVPTLVVWGEDDRWVKPEVARRLRGELPSARWVTIGGAGHAPMETHVAETASAVIAQFRTADPRDAQASR